MIKPRQVISGLFAVSLALAVCSCRTRSVYPVFPIRSAFSAAEVAGSWIGFTPNGTDLFRLELRLDSTSVLTQVYTSATNQEVFRFEISKWDIATNNVLTCSFSKLDVADSLKSAWPAKMTAKVTGTRLESELRNGEGGWKESIFFLREDDLDRKLKVLRQ